MAANPSPYPAGLPTGAAGGGLTGTYPNPTVVLDGTAGDIQQTGTAAAAGASGKVPDASHVHTQFFLGHFGNGSDGAVVLDGTTTFNGFSTLAGSTYTLTRDVQATTFTINNGVTLKSAGFRVFAAGAYTCNGTHTVAGNAAAGSTGGGGSPNGVYQGSGGGGTGGTGVNGGGTGGGAVNFGIAGGGGGAGTSGTAGAGGTVSTTSGATAAATLFNTPVPLLQGGVFFTSGNHGIQFGAGGGGGGSDASSNAGGGGGGGGGIIVILAWSVTVGATGVITVAGGAGANGAGGNAGGGGGGSGGLIAAYTLAAWTNNGSITAAGGAAGNKGGGTGANGNPGGAGVTLNVVLS